MMSKWNQQQQQQQKKDGDRKEGIVNVFFIFSPFNYFVPLNVFELYVAVVQLFSSLICENTKQSKSLHLFYVFNFWFMIDLFDDLLWLMF